MTREQAHTLQRSIFNEDTKIYDAEEIINKIYDDIDYFKCKNCKYQINNLHCEELGIEINKDNYCFLWEKGKYKMREDK